MEHNPKGQETRNPSETVPGSALGIKGIYSFEFVVDFFDRSRDFYVNKLGLIETHRSTPEWEDKFGSKGIYFQAKDVKIFLTSPKSSQSYTAQYLKILSPGIRKVTFRVKNLKAAIQHLQEHNATFVHAEKELRSDKSCHRFITIATPIGFLEFTFLEIEGDGIPMFESIPVPADFSSPILRIDHMTINTRTLYPICAFFEHVMDLKEFWGISFHTPDYHSGQEGTGLTSKVMWDPTSKIKFASNEPLYPHYNRSQIQTFIDRNHGAGIQHVALAVSNLIETVQTLRQRGVEFLQTPDTYYDLLPDRLESLNVGPLKENLTDIREQNILVDGKDGKYLLQIFLKDASILYHEDDAGPFFYEIIQRQGHRGFGEGNFRALFEAIEMQETRP